MKGILYVSTFIILNFLICPTILQDSFSLVAVNPFSTNNARINSITSQTSDGKYLVNLQYGSESQRKGQPSFFMANLFSRSEGKEIRMRHVDCDFIILRNGIELFRLSDKYGEPLFHSIDGVMLASFPFNETGRYSISVEIAGVLFIPIKPVFANFSAIVTAPTNESLKINLA
ncbi:MAG TPA: hypothetical protein VH481_10640 [Nitrososphaeraceae archaeon]|jgi:hypothetical protein